MGYDALDERRKWIERLRKWLALDWGYKGDRMDIQAEMENLVREWDEE